MDWDINMLRKNDMSYQKTIQKQMDQLPASLKWWPKYFYHFTNIDNALTILEKGWIFSRQKAADYHFMKTDNASSSVLSISQNRIKEYARLYFRPRTPTQYHNEGYKPVSVRDANINANCPIPIFFFLDSLTVLNMDGVLFSPVSCAGQQDFQFLSGADAFAKLPFEQIYHEGPFSVDNRDEVIRHRQAEVVRLDGIPIDHSIKGIACRSVAEKQTLLYQLRTHYSQAYQIYRTMIKYSPELDLFFNNGIFIRTVEYTGGVIRVLFNDPSKRYQSSNVEIQFVAAIYYMDNQQNVISRMLFHHTIEYQKAESIYLTTGIPDAKIAFVEIYLDDILMFQNIISTCTETLL